MSEKAFAAAVTGSVNVTVTFPSRATSPSPSAGSLSATAGRASAGGPPQGVGWSLAVLRRRAAPAVKSAALSSVSWQPLGLPPRLTEVVTLAAGAAAPSK